MHRDLAARNLIVSDEKELFIKVADFGLSRFGTSYKRAASGDPVRWAGPETFPPVISKNNSPFKGTVTLASDRWSFGILLYELFTFCAVPPYGEQTVEQIKIKLNDRADVSTFFELQDCPKGVNELIKKCLNYEQDKRPTFEMILDTLKSINDSITKDQWELPTLESMTDKSTMENTLQNRYDTPQVLNAVEYDSQNNQETQYDEPNALRGRVPEYDSHNNQETQYDEYQSHLSDEQQGKTTDKEYKELIEDILKPARLDTKVSNETKKEVKIDDTPPEFTKHKDTQTTEYESQTPEEN